MGRQFPKQNTAQQEWACEKFNKRTPIGSRVSYRNDIGKVTETTTRTEASVLGGHTAVVWLDGVSGCVSIERVTQIHAEG